MVLLQGWLGKCLGHPCFSCKAWNVLNTEGVHLEIDHLFARLGNALDTCSAQTFLRFGHSACFSLGYHLGMIGAQGFETLGNWLLYWCDYYNNYMKTLKPIRINVYGHVNGSSVL